MKYKTIQFEKTGGIGQVTLNRLDAMNAIDSQMMQELMNVADVIDEDNDIRAAILVGGDDRAFSIGVDFKELVEATRGIDVLQALNEIRRRLWAYNPWERWAALTKPTIAAIRGMAMGGGLELALACDIRLAAENATFGLPEVQQGIIPWHGGTQRLPRIVGRAKAIEMILTGETIDASEACRVGLVSKVVPTADILPSAMTTATILAKKAPIAVQYAREAINKGLDMTFDQGLRLELDLYILLLTTNDRAEGIRSFVEKRQPQFEGK